jgi:hypothetical protein
MCIHTYIEVDVCENEIYVIKMYVGCTRILLLKVATCHDAACCCSAILLHTYIHAQIRFWISIHIFAVCTHKCIRARTRTYCNQLHGYDI